MRLTSRERMMLIGFIVVLLVTGVVYYVYLPVFDALTYEQNALAENTRILEEIERNILPKEQQIKLIDAFRQKVEIMEKTLPPVLYQEDILRRINQVFEENNVEDLNYTFGLEADNAEKNSDEEAIGKIIAGYEDTLLDNFSKSMVEARFEQQNENEEADSDNWESIVSTINASIEVSGEYENIKKSIEDLENFENIVLVKTLTLAKNTDFQNEVVGTIDVQFPYYYDNETLEKLEWLYQSDFKEHKPFDYIVKGSLADPDRPISTTTPDGFDFGSLTDLTGSGLGSIGGNQNSGTSTTENTALKSDFEIIMSAPTSINNNYFISKADQRDLSLYSQRESETLTLTVTETGGRYSFFYSTSFTSFPGLNEFYGFVPNYEDAIYLTVVSTPRVDQKDVGMGTLNIHNKTGKPVKIFVKTDDVKLPRLIMGTQEGQVQVFR